MNFSQLGLAPAQLRACESLGYTEPTPIQRQAIPVVLSGRDLIGCAETGTGKTAAFLLPIIQKLSERALPGVRVLVLAPTRELAAQIQQNYTELNRVKNNRSVTVIGGANMRAQIADLRRGAAVVIATPGRLLDLTERGALNLSTVQTLVLDEADRMLDMGFLAGNPPGALADTGEATDAALFSNDVAGNRKTRSHNNERAEVDRSEHTRKGAHSRRTNRLPGRTRVKNCAAA